MKRFFINIFRVLFLLFVITACSPESWTSPSESGLPSASDIDASITLDQSINQVTFTLNNAACYPIWIFDGKTYSTTNGLSKIYSTYGTYNVEIKIGNANGISDASVMKSFTFDNSIIDFTSFITRLTGDSTKEWVIASSESGHISYGETGTDGTGLYSATPYEKNGLGIYDDVLTFGSDSSYTYNPGNGGTVCFNAGCSLYSQYNTANSDYMVPVTTQNTTYSFSVSGDNVYLNLPAQTFFPYIPYDASYTSPKFKITKLTSDRMELIADNSSVAWHFVLVSKASLESSRKGYDPNSNCNMWKDCTFTNSYYYAPGWSQIADPIMTQEGNSYTFSLPSATAQQWQAQCFFNTNLSTSSSTNYDFSCKLNSTKDISNVTVKLYKTGDNDTYYFVDNVSLDAYKDSYVIHTNLTGLDMSNVSMVLDFGGNAAGTEVTLSDVVLKEHSCDDGTVIENDNVNWDETSDCNLWKACTFTNSYYYAPGWSQISDPILTTSGTTYTINLPTATAEQWQAQCFFQTTMSSSSANLYDFHCVLNSTTSISNVTVKLYKNGDNDTYFFTKNISLSAYEDYELKLPALDGIDADQLNLVFDFGGNPANTKVTVSKIILKESTCNN